VIHRENVAVIRLSKICHYCLIVLGVFFHLKSGCQRLKTQNFEIGGTYPCESMAKLGEYL
jgi:hypothetical protein